RRERVRLVLDQRDDVPAGPGIPTSIPRKPESTVVGENRWVRAFAGVATQHIPCAALVPLRPARTTFTHHPITSSARARTAAGTLMPIALAVLTLITSSNLVGNSTARSPGFAPLRIFCT